MQELSTQQQALLEQKAGLSGAQQSLAAKIELLSGDLQDLRQQALERRKIPLQAKTKLEETRQQLQEHQEQLEEAIGLAKAEQAMFQENQKRLKELKAELGKEKDSVNRLKQLELEARLKKERALSSQEAVLLRIKEIISRLPDSLKARAEIEPARAFEWFQTSLTRFLSWREQARSAKDAITLKAPREAVLRNLVSSKEEQLSLLKEERTIAALQLKNLLTSRNQLFGNRRVEEFLQSQQQSLAAATHALSSLSQETARQEARMLLAIEQEQKAKDAYQHRIQQQEQASLALAIGLQGQDEAELRQALLKGPEWIRQTREALWEGQRGVEQWQVLVKERKASLEGWRSHAPLQSQEQAYSTVQLSELRRKQLQDVLLSTTQKLFQDGQLEHRKLELEPGLEGARRERSRWGILSELIGSADGKSFRTFAQGLTLELLLSYANENLAHLNPRYQLDRAPNPKKDARGDMNVQVIDLYMGGEIRPISSLSGGELFLASLALALGLASLAGQRTRVETVFIDEGFGSLDARTLDTALSALEVLQSEGRQVGIVSHVAALNERVGAQVLVQKVGADRSIVKVEAGR
jgi:exonuclease SbcC